MFIASSYYSSITGFEIGPLTSVTGAVLLCAISLRMRKNRKIYKGSGSGLNSLQNEGG